MLVPLTGYFAAGGSMRIATSVLLANIDRRFRAASRPAGVSANKPASWQYTKTGKQMRPVWLGSSGISCQL
jgi:hypothetical protein